MLPTQMASRTLNGAPGNDARSGDSILMSDTTESTALALIPPSALPT